MPSPVPRQSSMVTLSPQKLADKLVKQEFIDYFNRTLAKLPLKAAQLLSQIQRFGSIM